MQRRSTRDSTERLIFLSFPPVVLAGEVEVEGLAEPPDWAEQLQWEVLPVSTPDQSTCPWLTFSMHRWTVWEEPEVQSVAVERPPRAAQSSPEGQWEQEEASAPEQLRPRAVRVTEAPLE